ncbi:MAG: DinB family protein [Bacteroidota bacterium]
MLTLLRPRPIMTLASTLVELDDTRADLIALIDVLTPDQLAFSPAAGAWSAEGVAEHLLLTEEFILRAIEHGPDANLGPATPGVIDDMISVFRSDQQVQAPPFLEPTGQGYVGTRAGLVRLGARWQQIVDATPAGDRVVFEHPLAGPLSLLDTVRFVEAHAGHHRYQLARIAASPGYPS